ADSAADLLDLESPDGLQIRYATAHPAFRPATITSEVSNARRFVARLLSHAQPETWYSLEDFLTLAWQVRPGLLRGQQHTWATPVWWIECQRAADVAARSARRLDGGGRRFHPITSDRFLHDMGRAGSSHA